MKFLLYTKLLTKKISLLFKKNVDFCLWPSQINCTFKKNLEHSVQSHSTMCDFLDFGLTFFSIMCIQVVARLPQRLKSTFFERLKSTFLKKISSLRRQAPSETGKFETFFKKR